MRTTWIIDGAYIFNYGKARPVDYLKLKNELARLNGGPIQQCFYLNAVQDPPTDAQTAFHNWLKSAPPRGPKFRVQLYPLKEQGVTCPSCGHGHVRQVQKGVDVGIATLLVKLAAQDAFDRVILATGDGDFEDAISFIKDMHKQVWLLGSANNLSPDLQSYADEVIWLEDLGEVIDKLVV